ncbi:hypothetical protein ABT56_17360 [Photobacterium aquae]|uniref:FMN-binding domain-containing protein n=1 Tax=Photobacterium aquae TaxID=1195763 RepID=A0A0J1GVW9_9GAMM|nr:hypothetical protein ABT56_17360 [Photobacterium aquae]
MGFSQQAGLSLLLAKHFNVESVTHSENQTYRFTIEQPASNAQIFAAFGNGYGGPLVITFELDKSQRIRNVALVNHVDTPGYVVNVLNQRLLDRINGKKITDAFVGGRDIDGVSGATLTVNGITEAVRKAAHEEAELHGLTIDTVTTSWCFKLSDAALTLLVLMVLFERKMPTVIRKYHIMLVGVLSVMVIGYWANIALSVASVSSLMLGYWTPPKQNPSLYILLLTVMLGILWLGKNLYCSQLCPFHHIQRWLHKLGKNNLPLAGWVNHYGAQVIGVLLWLALVLIFVTRNPAVASYEPFSMLFSLEGVGVQWYILPLALFGSFFIKDYWCRLFCPLGRGLNILVDQRQQARKWWRKHKKAGQPKPMRSQSGGH